MTDNIQPPFLQNPTPITPPVPTDSVPASPFSPTPTPSIPVPTANPAPTPLSASSPFSPPAVKADPVPITATNTPPQPVPGMPKEQSKGSKIIGLFMQFALYAIFFFLGYIMARLQTLLMNI